MATTTVDVDLTEEDNRANENLQFHDGAYQSDAQTHTFSDFPHTAASDEEEEVYDKSQLLKEDKAPPTFWTFEYYQQFFDVETRQVLSRIFGSMTPRPNGNYLKTHIRPNPDLYGPFWICVTLVFTTAISGNMANYLQSAGVNYTWTYDFHKVTFAAAAIFSYWWLIPAAIYAVLWWRSSQAGYTFLEILCVYGYSLAIYIPISILWVVQINWFQWILVIVGAALSGCVLVMSFWPSVREDNKRVAYAAIIIIFLLHASLAIGFKLYFFNVSVNTAPNLTTTTHKMEMSTIKNIINNQALKLNQKGLPLKSGNSALDKGSKNKQTLKSKDSSKLTQNIPAKTADKTQQTLSDNSKKNSGPNQGGGGGGGAKDKQSESNLQNDIKQLVKR